MVLPVATTSDMMDEALVVIIFPGGDGLAYGLPRIAIV